MSPAELFGAFVAEINGAFPTVMYERMDSGDNIGIDPAFLS